MARDPALAGQTSDPILHEEVLGWLSMPALRPLPKGYTRHVFVDTRGRVYAPLEPITFLEGVKGLRRLHRLYEIDVGEHVAGHQVRLPCKEKGFYFDVELRFGWRVHDPGRIVEDRRTNVEPLYSAYLTTRINQHAEEFGLEDRAEAQSKLQSELDDPMVLDEGITIVRCMVGLALSEEAEKYLGEQTRARFRIKDIEYATEESRVDNTLQMQKGHQEAEQRLREAELEADLAELRRRQATAQKHHEHELQELELKAQFERMRQYKDAVKEGRVSYLLIFLDRHPQDVGSLIQLLLSERNTYLEQSRRIVTQLYDSGLLDRAHLAPLNRAAKRALQNLYDGLDPASFDAALNEEPEARSTWLHGPGLAPAAESGRGDQEALPDDAEGDGEGSEDDEDDADEGDGDDGD